MPQQLADLLLEIATKHGPFAAGTVLGATIFWWATGWQRKLFDSTLKDKNQTISTYREELKVKEARIDELHNERKADREYWVKKRERKK